MDLPAFIDKFPRLRRDKNYEFLRTRGLQYLRELAAEQWTDHNIHDPGITQLEMMCYAITDLAYKTDFAIEDILAERGCLDLLQQGPAQNDGPADSFYSAREILPCNPVTLNDWRKLVIDVPGIRNAWFEMSEQSLPAIYRDPLLKELTYHTNSRTRRLNIDGLYDIQVEFESHDQLGDLNLWRYEFGLSADPTRQLRIYFEANWEPFYTNDLAPDAFAHAWFDTLVSIEDTSIYKTRLNLQRLEPTPSISVAFEVHVESPLAKTESARQIIDQELARVIDDIGIFLRQRISRCSQLGRAVRAQVHRHRNLCEDFVGLRHSEVEEIGLCSDIEIDAGVDPDDALAQIYLVMEQFLAPSIAFYTLDEMLKSGHSTGEVFNGPALRHGFIREQDLEKAQYRKVIRVSDLIQLLMDINGVVAVRSLQLSRFFQGLLLDDGEEWCLPVGPERALRLNVAKSRIIFYKGFVPHQGGSREEALKRLPELRAAYYRSRLPAGDYDLPVPRGQARGLKAYQSIQNDFPQVYGIGPQGLGPSASARRKAQAKQLKAFLSMIDQILANYTAQLANVSTLFSIDDRVQRSYFSQLLFSLPETYQLTSTGLATLAQHGLPDALLTQLESLIGRAGLTQQGFLDQLDTCIGRTARQQHQALLLDTCRIPEVAVANLPNGANLVRDFVRLHEARGIDWDRPASFAGLWNDYLIERKNQCWQGLCARDAGLETAATFEKRRNRFLDHLLARFAEQFTDYVLLNTHLDGIKTGQELIQDKLEFLREYPLLSHDRGRGFDYLAYGAATNVSGLEMRASRLLGIHDWRRSRLASDLFNVFEVYDELDDDGITEWRFRLRDDLGNTLYSSTRHYHSEVELHEAMLDTLDNGIRFEQYQIRRNRNGRYYFVLFNAERQIVVRIRRYFDTRDAVERKIRDIINLLHFRKTREEGFHLVEHVLLRPVASGDRLFNIDCDNSCSPGYRDPYSFRVTAVVPYWPERFRNMEFRRFFEATLRQEAPAHVHVKICWVDKESMQTFERAFFHWLELKSRTLFTHHALLSGNQALIDSQAELIGILQNLNSVYPESQLFDCESDNESGTLVLNQAKLGSTRGDENGHL
jgi:ribosomal protein S6